MKKDFAPEYERIEVKKGNDSLTFFVEKDNPYFKGIVAYLKNQIGNVGFENTGIVLMGKSPKRVYIVPMEGEYLRFFTDKGKLYLVSYDKNCYDIEMKDGKVFLTKKNLPKCKNTLAIAVAVGATKDELKNKIIFKSSEGSYGDYGRCHGRSYGDYGRCHGKSYGDFRGWRNKKVSPLKPLNKNGYKFSGEIDSYGRSLIVYSSPKKISSTSDFEEAFEEFLKQNNLELRKEGNEVYIYDKAYDNLYKAASPHLNLIEMLAKFGMVLFPAENLPTEVVV